MQSPAIFLVGTILLSFGVTAALLVGLMFLDWVEVRRTHHTSLNGPSAQLPGKSYQPAARRRQLPGQTVAKAA
jgi:hypothetical protein